MTVESAVMIPSDSAAVATQGLKMEPGVLGALERPVKQRVKRIVG